jgi:hypothetical protein
MLYFAGVAVPFRFSDMGGKKKGVSAPGRGSSTRGQGGGSKTLPLDQKQTVSTVGEGEGTPSAHKHDDLKSIPNSQGVQQMEEADPSSSGLQVGTGMKHAGESECKEVTPDSISMQVDTGVKHSGEMTPDRSISTGCEVSDMWRCTECRRIVKEMIDTHPQKDDYVAKLGELCIAHAVEWRQMLEGPSGEQKSDIQSSDVESSMENQSAGLLPAEVSCSHIFTLGSGNERYSSVWRVKVCCVSTWFEIPVLGLKYRNHIV